MNIVLFFNLKLYKLMPYFMFNVEIVFFNPSGSDAFIDVDVDIVEISASTLKAAKEQLKNKFNMSSEFFCQSAHRIEYIGKSEEALTF